MKSFTIEHLHTIRQSEVVAQTDIVALGRAVLEDGTIVTWTFMGYKLDSNDNNMHWTMRADKNISDIERKFIAADIYNKVFRG